MKCKNTGSLFCRFFSAAASSGILYSAYRASTYVANNTSETATMIKSYFAGNISLPRTKIDINPPTENFEMWISNLNFPARSIVSEEMRDFLESLPTTINSIAQPLIWGCTALFVAYILKESWKSYFCPPQKTYTPSEEPLLQAEVQIVPMQTRRAK